MVTLYITRHGETVWNTEGRMQGWKDSALTAQGIQQADWLRDRLKDVEFKAIYSSPSDRTLNTAEIIRGNRSLEIIKDENLREIGLGNWEGMLMEDIRSINAEEISAFWERPHLYKSISGENYEDVRKRAIIAVKNILERHKDGNILIVTHTVVLKLIMSFFTDTPLEKLWEPPFIHQTSLSVVNIENDKADVVLHGDISHYKNKD